MSDNESPKAGATKPPTSPPNEVGKDDGGRPKVVVEFCETGPAGEKGGESTILATVELDPIRNNTAFKQLSPRGVPPLFATVGYIADYAMVTTGVLQSDAELLSIANFGPTDMQMSVRLSDATYLSVHVYSNCKAP